MEFQIPEHGTEEWVDLLCLLDRARYENAKAWVVVVIDDDTDEVCNAYGPFDEAEQALIESGRQDAEWKAHADPEEGNWTYKIVPLWGPGE